jgi:hypothetical protein
MMGPGSGGLPERYQGALRGPRSWISGFMWSKPSPGNCFCDQENKAAPPRKSFSRPDLKPPGGVWRKGGHWPGKIPSDSAKLFPCLIATISSSASVLLILVAPLGFRFCSKGDCRSRVVADWRAPASCPTLSLRTDLDAAHGKYGGVKQDGQIHEEIPVLNVVQVILHILVNQECPVSAELPQTGEPGLHF